MGVSEFDKDIAVPTGERRASTSTKSHTSEISEAIERADLEDDNRSSLSAASSISIAEIHHTLTRNTGHAYPGDKKLADLTAVATNATQDPRFEVDFDDNGENPHDWSMARKAWVIFSMSFSTLMVVMYSTSYTAGTTGMMHTFGIKSETLIVLGITFYLLGLAVGCLLLAPLSEMYGRRPVYLISVLVFCVFIIPCALSNNLAQILIFRFLGAIAGAAMISNAPGTVNDIVNEEYRAFAFSVWSLGPMNGPVIGPVIGGFVFQALGWRWVNYIPLFGAAVSWLFVFSIKETYAPALLRAKAAKMRKQTQDDRWYSRYDEKKLFWPLLRENLYRPFTMAIQEPICIFWNLYIALVYGVLYLCFVAYPIVFGELRGWKPGLIGLSYTGIGIGGVITILCEPLLRRMIHAHKKDPATGKQYPEAMVSAVCIAAVLVPVGQLIFSWTCTPNVHWIFPILAGIPFGAGNCGVFIYASNYLVHSYGIYAASALAGNAVLRSALGGSLPLAGPQMYAKLGPHWAGTMLALLEFAMIPIPVLFYLYGHKIRERSKLIRQMREDREKLENKKKRMQEKVDGFKSTDVEGLDWSEKKELEV